MREKKKQERNKVDGEVEEASNNESEENEAIVEIDNDGNNGNDGNDGNDGKVNEKESKNDRKNSTESSNNVANDAVIETLEESNEDEVYNETLDENDGTQLTDDEDDLVPEKENYSDFSRALLAKIIQNLKGKDLHTDLITIWNILISGGTCLELTTFQATVLEVAGFYPSINVTSSFFLNLDDDRSGYVEQQEFFKFARTLLDDDGNLIVDQNLLENTVLVDEQPAVHLPTHIDGSSLDGWDLLILTWTLDEKEIRTMVHDFGGMEEKCELVLLDELTMAREDIDDAWKSFRSLSAFKSRMAY